MGLNEALGMARILVSSGERNADHVKRKISEILLQRKAAKIDYVEIVEADSLRPAERIEGEVMIALAVRIGKTRLIDNVVLPMR